MSFFSRLVEEFFDFLFPKSKKVIELENLSAGDLIKILPPSTDELGDSTIAIFDYSHPVVKEIVWEIKYRGNQKIASRVGEIIYDVLVQELAERALLEKFTNPLIIPMPISGKRRQERGWNQAEIICEAVRTCDKERVFKYVPGQLVKHRHTERQTTTASKKEREENIKGSMHVVHPPSVEGKCIFLIDDVYTTGSTVAEAKCVLKGAGAKKIIAVALAH